jgi:uncharacterized phage protein (TIGR01671 family)
MYTYPFTIVDFIRSHTDPVFDNSAYGLRAEDFTFLQSTGLKDKNGVEIFEGDVISFAGAIWTMAWHTMKAGFTLCSTHAVTTERYVASAGVPIRNFNFLDGGVKGYLQDQRLTDDIEVIGNIYQDPDLLPQAA